MNLLQRTVSIRRWLICRVFKDEFVYKKFGENLDFLYEKFMGDLIICLDE
jgi:hypothetical protein